MRHFTKDFNALLLRMYFGSSFQSLDPSTLINLNPTSPGIKYKNIVRFNYIIDIYKVRSSIVGMRNTQFNLNHS